MVQSHKNMLKSYCCKHLMIMDHSSFVTVQLLPVGLLLLWEIELLLRISKSYDDKYFISAHVKFDTIPLLVAHRIKSSVKYVMTPCVPTKVPFSGDESRDPGYYASQLALNR